MKLTIFLALLAHVSGSLSTPAKRLYDTHDYYVLEHRPTAGASLADIAHALGVQVVEQAGELANHWVVHSPKSTDHPLARQGKDRIVARLEELTARAAPSAYLSARSEDVQQAKRIVSSIRYFEPQTLRSRTKRAPPPIIEAAKPHSDNNTAHAVALRLGISDPLFQQQWHLVNDEYPQHSMNPNPVWEMGYTGKGIISAMVDDGLDYNSKDLAANFVSSNFSFYVILLITLNSGCPRIV